MFHNLFTLIEKIKLVQRKNSYLLLSYINLIDIDFNSTRYIYMYMHSIFTGPKKKYLIISISNGVL